MKLAFRFALWFGVTGCLIVIGGAKTGKPDVEKTPVSISVQKLEGTVILFQALLPPRFYGEIHGSLPSRINECVAVTEPVAELKNGTILNNMVLHCKGADIVVHGVLFQN